MSETKGTKKSATYSLVPLCGRIQMFDASGKEFYKREFVNGTALKRVIVHCEAQLSRANSIRLTNARSVCVRFVESTAVASRSPLLQMCDCLDITLVFNDRETDAVLQQKKRDDMHKLCDYLCQSVVPKTQKINLAAMKLALKSDSARVALVQPGGKFTDSYEGAEPRIVAGDRPVLVLYGRKVDCTKLLPVGLCDTRILASDIRLG
jgi:hypothetical protein